MTRPEIAQGELETVVTSEWLVPETYCVPQTRDLLLRMARELVVLDSTGGVDTRAAPEVLPRTRTPVVTRLLLLDFWT